MPIHVTMLYNIDVEFIQAFNPLYALPIVAVVLCALIVYAFGFKSPIQPPSFDGLEDDRKSSKKRKAKEIHKQSKLLTNGKTNGLTAIKGKVQELSRKKDVMEGSIANGKTKSKEKIPTDKKAAKNSKSRNEKLQLEKKESFIADDVNDDGWVQHVSKKGKKNRKKDDNTVSDTQSSNSPSFTKTIVKTNEASDSDKIPPKQTEEIIIDAKKQDNKEQPLKKSVKKETTVIPEKSAKKETTVIPEKSAKKETTVIPEKSAKKETTAIPEKSVKDDVSVEMKPDINHPMSDQKTNIPTVATKSKKKKSVAPALEKTAVATVPLLESSSDVIAANSDLPKVPEPVVDNVVVNKSDTQTNVVFDELAGLYPEAKEKKKKKVRRDH